MLVPHETQWSFIRNEVICNIHCKYNIEQHQSDKCRQISNVKIVFSLFIWQEHEHKKNLCVEHLSIYL